MTLLSRKCQGLGRAPEVELSDAALVAATLDGNKEAFAVLAERHRPMLVIV